MRLQHPPFSVSSPGHWRRLSSPLTLPSTGAVQSHRIPDGEPVETTFSRGPLDTLDADATALDRLTRLEALDELLPTLAGVLDLREVFSRVSQIAQRVLPHDALGLPLLTEDRRHIVPYAVAGGLRDVPIPERIPIPETLLYLTQTRWDYRIIDDLQAADGFKDTPPAKMGFRSCLMVPIHVHGEHVGLLNFLSSTLRHFRSSDVLIARRIADHVALALSHQRLAEEAARAAEERERAARLEQRVRALSDELSSLTAHHRVVGDSAAWQAVLRHATQVAETDTTVLLLGESGTGKEVVARFIHRASPRRDGTLVAVNCAALPDQLLESELFGYERGAFTGATQAKPGQIELASGGTLLLDEIGEMSGAAQAKLLRVIETHEVQRLGTTRVRRADVRVIAATNRDLRRAVERGTFREDLYYRLNVFAIELPALRDRPEDILPLSEAFLRDLGRSFGRPPAGISRDASAALLVHLWPGNIRELRNTLERAAILCEGGLITAEHLSLSRPRATRAVTEDETEPPTTDLWSVERALVKKALEEARFNKSRAARTLGLTRTQLYVRLRRYGLV
jgi:transcriptional regulator with GAF, ATPase, and Fis domain